MMQFTILEDLCKKIKGRPIFFSTSFNEKDNMIHGKFMCLSVIAKNDHFKTKENYLLTTFRFLGNM